MRFKSKPMLTILLIDDDETEYFLIKRMMQDCYDKPYLLRYSDTLEKAITVLQNEKIDVILLDDKLGKGRTAQTTVPELKNVAQAIPMIVISSAIDAAYLKDKTILNVYDIVDKYHLRQKIEAGILSETN